MERLPKKELHGQNPVVTYATKQALNSFEAQSKTRPTPPTGSDKPSYQSGGPHSGGPRGPSTGNYRGSRPPTSSYSSGRPPLISHPPPRAGDMLRGPPPALGPPPGMPGISCPQEPVKNQIVNQLHEKNYDNSLCVDIIYRYSCATTPSN